MYNLKCMDRDVHIQLATVLQRRKFLERKEENTLYF